MIEKINLKLPKKGYKLFKKKTWLVFAEGVWHNNPIFGMVLGLCSALAVTNLMANAFVMSIAVTVVLIANSAVISLIRNIIPDRIRMITYMLIVSTLVITVDLILKILFPTVSSTLGPYVALIITNCIVMGRCEAFAINNPPGLSIADALGSGIGYTFSLMIIAFFRELIGFGSLFGFRVIPESITPMALFSVPPGAFFALAIFIFFVNYIKKKFQLEGKH
ncbi:MAG: NADH:ubiquinone reductase (Na(+)-transporting) subunit D [bacterium]|nr:NADH:ubiquinone reductase (Na(+)-transporting) subunit D [bacterium]